MSAPDAAVFARAAHDSALEHVTGRAQFIDDMPELPGTLEVVLVTSPHAHAEIVGIDAAPARATPGVHAVLTAADIPGTNDIGPITDGEPALACGVAEYAGAPVAAVAATTFDQAFAAAGLVEVTWSQRPALLTIDEALRHETYTSPPQTMRRGDSDAAIAGARHRISGEVRCGGQDHFYLEGHIALAVPRDNGDLDVFSSTQHPTEVQHAVAAVLGIPFSCVTVEVRRMGGGFGGKESQASIIAAIAALVAAKTGRPAKLRLRRDADMIVTGKRHDGLFRYTAGFDSRGRIEGVDIMIALRAGTVADLSSSVLTRAMCHIDNCYFLPDITVRGYPCRTNTVSNTAFRGFGGPQGMLAIETVVEHVARHLGLDVDDVRDVNWYGTEDRNTTPYGQQVSHNLIDTIVTRLRSAADWEGTRREIERFNAANRTLKKGIAMMPAKFGISFNVPRLNQAGALVHVYTDGSVHLNHGGTEMGQGLFIKVAQVVASVFGIALGDVKVSATRTDKVPNTVATAASSGSDLNGMAAFNAATTVRNRMADVAARALDAAADTIEFRHGRVYAGNESLSFARLAQLSWDERVSLSATGYYATPGITWDADTMTGHPAHYYTFGAAIAVVVIDTLTGESRVLKTDILQDCGASLNPAIDIGQIEGGFVQGQGWLTSEELVWDGDGHLLTHGPSTYKIPGSRDVAPEFSVHILPDMPNPVPTIYRSKAVGEPPLLLAISVWLAIRDAVARLAGYRHLPRLDAPATPEAILMAVDDIRARDSRQ